MSRGILEGLIKPKVKIEADMSRETNGIHNIYRGGFENRGKCG